MKTNTKPAPAEVSVVKVTALYAVWSDERPVNSPSTGGGFQKVDNPNFGRTSRTLFGTVLSEADSLSSTHWLGLMEGFDLDKSDGVTVVSGKLRQRHPPRVRGADGRRTHQV